MRNTYKFSLAFLIISILSYIIIFKDLSLPQIRMWDEATYANNSIDFYEYNNILNVTHLGEIDWYNTKPPLVIWLQGIAMNIFGVNELSVRIPSAIFGFLTILLVFAFGWFVVKNKVIGFLAALILLTSKGYITNHVVLTGDLDSTLVFWLTFGLLVYIYVLNNKPDKANLYFAILSTCLFLGFLTKGIAGFFFAPCMLIIYLINNRFKVFSDKRIYYTIFTALFFSFCYYLLREYNNPGYLRMVWDTEIMRIGNNVMSWHVHPFNFYYEKIIDNSFTPYIYILLLLIPAIFYLYKINGANFNILLYLSISALYYLLLISYPAIKLEWYDAPLYPILALIVSIIFYETISAVIRMVDIKKVNLSKELIILVTGVLLLTQPVLLIQATNEYSEEDIYEMEIEGAYSRFLVLNYPIIDNITVFKQEKNIELYDQILFYKRAFEINNKLKINITNELNFNPGELVMICNQQDKENILKLYEGDIVNTWQKGILYKVISKK